MCTHMSFFNIFLSLIHTHAQHTVQKIQYMYVWSMFTFPFIQTLNAYMADSSLACDVIALASDTKKKRD